ncbi:MAG: orotidine-5'-phosphate decarboxylase [Elusimicrobia bacterium]|nr:orotidine-5'-phosphate decarboxylase [Elusimicrobiota bacterium]
MIKKGIIVALDVDGAIARRLVTRLGPIVDFYKVPPALTLEDPALMNWLLKRKKKVFLDCKWFDIPSQVARSVAAAGRAGVTAVTLHAGAGSAILKAAVAVVHRPRIWAVTVLTCLGPDDLKEVGFRANPLVQVLRLARLAQQAGVDGLVCSPREVGMLRRAGIRLPLITPGITHGGHVGSDQKRVATPQQAWSAGANYLVLGRSVLEAPDPAAAARDILSFRR